MAEKSNYFVLRAKAVPEVLLKVVEAKRTSFTSLIFVETLNFFV